MCGQVLWRRTGPILLTNAGCRHCSFWCLLINLLRILLRRTGFARIQRAIMDQTSSRSPNSDHDTFFGASLALRSALELLLSLTMEMVVAGIKSNWYKIQFSSYITIWSINSSLLHRIREGNTSKRWIFFLRRQLTKQPLIKLFHLSDLLQMPNDHRIVDIEFLGNFSCSCKRVSFDDYSQLVVKFHWLPTTLLLFKALISFTKLLEPPLPFIFISSSTALYIHYHSFSWVQFSHSVVSDSLQPEELQHTRPPCPSSTPGVH